MGRKRRRKHSPRTKARQQAPVSAAPPPSPKPDWTNRLWLILGAAGLFLSGSLIGSVIGTQVARQDHLAEVAALEQAQRKAEPGYTQRNRSSHALSIFSSEAPTESPDELSSSSPEPEPEPEAETAAAEPETGRAQRQVTPSLRAPAALKTEDVAPTPEPAEAARVQLPPQEDETLAERERPAEQLAWQRHAVQVDELSDGPAIAIVIDDLGLNLPNTRKMIALPAPLSLAFMTYGHNLERLTGAARRAGHELLVHVPMEPIGDDSDPGPRVLRTGLDRTELARRLEWGLGRFPGYVGINNHMGSRFTASASDMAFVMRELKDRGLMFLDSQTAADSVGEDAAEEAGVPFAARDIFLDNVAELEAIGRQLVKLERVAKRRGFAVAIGHPYSETIAALEAWIPDARARGFSLVPISHIAELRAKPTMNAQR